MKFIELKPDGAEGWPWIVKDRTKALLQRMNQQDNVHALNVYFQDVHITNTVKVLASRTDCKWFFDLMAIKLNALNVHGVNAVFFCMTRDDDEWRIWSLDDQSHGITYSSQNSEEFPLSAIALRAVHEEKFWHVRLVMYEI